MTTTFSPRFWAHCWATVNPKNPEPTTTRSAFTHSPKVWTPTSGYPSNLAVPHEASRVRRQVRDICRGLEQPHRGCVVDVDHREVCRDVGPAGLSDVGQRHLRCSKNRTGQGLSAPVGCHRDRDLPLPLAPEVPADGADRADGVLDHQEHPVGSGQAGLEPGLVLEPRDRVAVARAGSGAWVVAPLPEEPRVVHSCWA